MAETKKPTKVAKPKSTAFVEAVGRRKEAVARVRLLHGEATVQGVAAKKGDVVVNGKTATQHGYKPYDLQLILKPLLITETDKDYIVSAKVAGGGQHAQLEAIGHGLARALSAADTVNARPKLKAAGLLTRDPRAKERRKVGTGGKARRAKQSPKR